MDVTVVGGGSWGTTIAHVAAGNGHNVTLLLRDEKVALHINRHRENPKYLPEKRLNKGIRATTNWESALKSKAELIVIAVPSGVMDRVARRISLYISPDTPVLSASKGLAPPGLTTMTEVIARYIKGPTGALGGPNLSMEILQGQPTASVVGSKDKRVIELSVQLLSSERYRVYGSLDPLGVQLAGALKNIYAIGAGIAEALGFGLNAKAFFLTRALAEMERLGRSLGADPLTFHGLAGMGDLIATANSTYSRNFRLGMLIANKVGLKEAVGILGQVAEGAGTVSVVHEYVQTTGLDMPQAEGIYRVLYEGADVHSVIRGLMTRKKLFEEY